MNPVAIFFLSIIVLITIVQIVATIVYINHNNKKIHYTKYNISHPVIKDKEYYLNIEKTIKYP